MVIISELLVYCHFDQCEASFKLRIFRGHAAPRTFPLISLILMNIDQQPFALKFIH